MKRLTGTFICVLHKHSVNNLEKLWS